VICSICHEVSNTSGSYQWFFTLMNVLAKVELILWPLLIRLRELLTSQVCSSWHVLSCCCSCTLGVVCFVFSSARLHSLLASVHFPPSLHIKVKVAMKNWSFYEKLELQAVEAKCRCQYTFFPSAIDKDISLVQFILNCLS
jgi:hypothetical protein